jgi:hypothetical protein
MTTVDTDWIRNRWADADQYPAGVQIHELCAEVDQLREQLRDIRRQWLDLADERDRMRRARDAGWARVDRARKYVADLWHPEKGGPANRREVQRDLEAILGGAS